MRFAPATYIEMVRKAGGFTLVFEHQLYPHGSAEFAKEVREALGIKVDCPSRVYEGTIKRLLRYHVGLP